MGSILCCVEDKRDYSLGKDEHYKPDFTNESENGIRMYIKQPLDKKEQVITPFFPVYSDLYTNLIFPNPLSHTYPVIHIGLVK